MRYFLLFFCLTLHICCYGTINGEIRTDTTVVNVQGVKMLKVCQWYNNKCVETRYFLADAPFERIEPLAEPYTDYHALSYQSEWFFERPSNQASLSCVIATIIRTCLSDSTLKKVEDPARLFAIAVIISVTAKGDVSSVGLYFCEGAPDVLTDEEKVMIMKGILIEKFNFCDFPKAAASFVSRTIFFDRLGHRKKQFYKDLLLK